MTDQQGLQLLIAVIVFAFGSFGAAILGFVALHLSQRPTAAALYKDTIYLCIMCSFTVLLEVSTLIWDCVYPAHFPLYIRVPALLLLVPTMTGTSLRLLYKYVVDVRREVTKDNVSVPLGHLRSSARL